MFSTSQWQRPLLALVAVFLCLYSFSWARQHPEYTWDAPIIMVAGALLLGYTLRRTYPRAPKPTPTTIAAPAAPLPPFAEGMAANAERDTPPPTPPVPSTRKERDMAVGRIALIGLSGILVVVLLAQLIPPQQVSYLPHFLMWLGAIAAYTLAIVPPRPMVREDWGMWWAVHRNTVIVVTLIVVGAFVLRAWDLEHIPMTVGGDEGSQGVEALKVLAGEIRNPFTTGWLGVPTMSFYYNALTIGPMGPTITALRLPWAIIGTATVLLLFWLVTRLFGVKLGVVAAALLAAYHFHIHFSRLGSNQVADPFFIVLLLLFLYRGRDRNSAMDFIIAGVVTGVAQYFYAGARLTMIMLGVMLLHYIWLDRSRSDTFKQSLRYAFIAGFAFLITAAPMLQYAVRFPNDYNARINQVGIFQSGWVDREIALRGNEVTAVDLVIEQTTKVFLMFNYYPDRTVWYGSPRPAMEGVWAVLFMLGLLYCSVRLLPPRSENRFFPFVVWWWTGLILGGTLTELPPSYQRLITLAPSAVFFVAYILYRTVQIFQNAISRRDNRFTAIALTTAVLLLGAYSVDWYFRGFTPLNDYGSLNGEIATSMGKVMNAEMQPDQQAVFLGPPQMYLGFGTIPYLDMRATVGIDVAEPLTAPPTNQSLGVRDGMRPFFFAVPSRAGELDWVAQAYPGGERREIPATDGGTLYWIYIP